jgi:hypothetical protein
VWDDDRNLNPLYLVRASPTFGDLAGGALEGPLTAPVLADVQVGPTSAYPAGQVLNGVAVTVAAPVSTELPVAHLTAGTQALTSEATFPSPSSARGWKQACLHRPTSAWPSRTSAGSGTPRPWPRPAWAP